MLFDSVSNPANGPAVNYEGDELKARRDIVRLSALLHDTGHCILSHVSERFYEQDKDLQEAQKRLRKYYRNNNIAPAETLTILILRSEAFQKLLTASSIRRSVFQDREIIDKACSCIAGSKPRILPDAYLAEIINGPVDCDKVDYLARDAHMAGVPISLDIERLCSKLRLIRTIGDEGQVIYSLAIVPSGARALEEMLVSRIFLYDKFYYHPKIMAAEEVIRRALGHLANAFPQLKNPTTLLNFGDDEFLSLSEKGFISRFGETENKTELTRGCELLGRARSRDLPKRAFAFALRYMPEIPEAYSRFINKGKADPTRQSVSQWKETDRLLSSSNGPELHAAGIEKILHELKNNESVFVGYQSAGRAAGKMDTPVLMPDGKVDPTPDFLFNVSKWSDAYALNKQTSYVFSYGRLPEVHLAAERFYAERELTFAPSSWVFSKLGEGGLAAARSALPVTTEWLPHRLAPNFLQSDVAQRRLELLRAKYASFLKGLHTDIGPLLIESWVWQFGDADLQENAISLLEHIRFIEKPDIIEGFREVVDRTPELKEAVWVPLRQQGGGGKSADLVRYDLKPLGLETRDVGALDTATLKSAGRIVFFDDLLNSGTQVEALLTSWFLEAGAACESPGDKDPMGKLPQEIIDGLRKVPIEFAYYSAHPIGIDRLKRASEKVALPMADVHYSVDTSQPDLTLYGFKGASKPSCDRFIEYLKARGKQLLEEKYFEDKAKLERASKFALGFADLRMTLLYSHAVSTAMPVALWQASTSILSPWLPIFPRDEDGTRTLLERGIV